MITRCKSYESFFGIETRAARYKITKETKRTDELKTYEKFIAMLSIEDIEQIIKFVEEESPLLNIQLKRNKSTLRIKSSIYPSYDLITIASINGTFYQAYKERDKKPKQILNEYNNKLLLEEQKRQEILEFQKEENEWIDYYKEQFAKQTEFQSFDAFQLHMQEEEQESMAAEEMYRRLPTTSDKSYLLTNYGAFLYAEESIRTHCTSFFEEKIYQISKTIHEKEIVEYLMKEDILFSKLHKEFAQIFKLPSELILHIGQKYFSELFKIHKIEHFF